MKNVKIILAMVTVIVLLALDQHAAEEILEYGLAFRSLVWFIITCNVVMFYEGIRGVYADE